MQTQQDKHQGDDALSYKYGHPYYINDTIQSKQQRALV